MAVINKRIVRYLANAALAIYLLICIFILATKYIVLPNINSYRGFIEHQVSRAVGGPVSIEHVHAEWQGFGPNIRLRNLNIKDSYGDSVLFVPDVNAGLSWRSIVTLLPEFRWVRAKGIDLSAHRDFKNKVWVMGREVPLGPVMRLSPQAVKAIGWLLSQPSITVYDSSVRWRDHMYINNSIDIDRITINITNDKTTHNISARAYSKDLIDGELQLNANVLKQGLVDGDSMHLDRLSGDLYTKLNGVNPEILKSWVGKSSYWQAGNANSQIWMDISSGTIERITSDITVSSPSWYVDGLGVLKADELRFYSDGNLDDFDIRMRTSNATVYMPEVFTQKVEVSAFGGNAKVSRLNNGFSAEIESAVFENDDLQMILHGSWVNEMDGYGIVDLKARIPFARISASHKYIPTRVNHQVSLWLKNGLRSGYVHNGHAHIKGNISDFSFESRDASDVLEFILPFSNVWLDYSPPIGNDSGWPALYDVEGSVRVNGTSMIINASKASLASHKSAVVRLKDITAHIRDIAGHATLSVDGNTYGNAQAYVDFLRVSPLGAQLDNAFDHTKASGKWSVPLSLFMPLTGVFHAEVNGLIELNDSSIKFDEYIPEFQGLSGKVIFSESGIEIDNLEGIFLGGRTTISGLVDQDKSKINLNGEVDDSSLKEIVPLPGMQRISGKTSYKATVTGIGSRNNILPKLVVSSDLKGFSIDAPQPLGKEPGEVLNSSFLWKYDTDKKRELNVSVDNVLNGIFVHDPLIISNSYFHSAAVSLGDSATLDAPGTVIDIKQDFIDLDAWNQLIKEFSDNTNEGYAHTIFPALNSVYIESDRGRLIGMNLDFMHYTQKNQNNGVVESELVSAQASASFKWQEQEGQIIGPVKMHFSNLSVGQDSNNESHTDNDISDELNIPAIDMTVDNLVLYGHRLGSLKLSGVNKVEGHEWEINNLTLDGDGFKLVGRGSWQLKGENRGLDIEATATIDNLGKYATQIGYEDLLYSGNGFASASVKWHDLPWSFDLSSLNGVIEFELEKGRLSTLHSKSAQLLEFISMQSIKRLGTFNVNPLDTAKEGFPYDVAKGIWNMNRGMVYAEDIRVIGPVGTIMLDGLVNMPERFLNLEAVVVPNLDVSGAAVAAGIAINPLVGLGAFITQWLLQAPLGKAMALHYEITGSLDNPEIIKAERLQKGDEGSELEEVNPITP